jgi:hypothetical protein
MDTKTTRPKPASSNPFLPRQAAEIGGARLDDSGFTSKTSLHASQLAMLFTKQVKAFADLSQTAARLFEMAHAMASDTPGVYEIPLSYSALIKDSMSRSTYQRGMAELIEKRIVCPSATEGHCWINPTFVFNGRSVRQESIFELAPSYKEKLLQAAIEEIPEPKRKPTTPPTKATPKPKNKARPSPKPTKVKKQTQGRKAAAKPAPKKSARKPKPPVKKRAR